MICQRVGGKIMIDNKRMVIYYRNIEVNECAKKMMKKQDASRKQW
jgi:hypothetical protein